MEKMEINNQITKVKIEDIIPNRLQPRVNFDEEALNELASSIKIYGVIQPLILRKVGLKYEIIAGERRYKASQIAGLTEVPAIITSMDDQTSAELAIIENLQREGLSGIEEAKSYKKLLDLGNLTQDQLAVRMGKSQSTIANKLRLLNLPEEVQDALLHNKISERHARSLLTLKKPQDQINLLNRIIKERLTVKATDAAIREINNGEGKNSSTTNSPKPTIDSLIMNPKPKEEPSPIELFPNIPKADVINIKDLNDDNIESKIVGNNQNSYNNINNINNVQKERKEESNMNNQIPSFDSLLKPATPVAPTPSETKAPQGPQVQIPAPSPAGNKFFPDLENESVNMDLGVPTNQAPNPSFNSFLTPPAPAEPAPINEPISSNPLPPISPLSSPNNQPEPTPITPPPMINPFGAMPSPEPMPAGPATPSPIPQADTNITPPPMGMPTPSIPTPPPSSPANAPFPNFGTPSSIPPLNSVELPSQPGMPNSQPQVSNTPEPATTIPGFDPITPPVTPSPAPMPGNIGPQPLPNPAPSVPPINPQPEPVIPESPIPPTPPVMPITPPSSTPAPEPQNVPQPPASNGISLGEPSIGPATISTPPLADVSMNPGVSVAPAPNNGQNISNALNNIRDTINEVKRQGFNIDTQEHDFTDKYQIIINIQK